MLATWGIERTITKTLHALWLCFLKVQRVSGYCVWTGRCRQWSTIFRKPGYATFLFWRWRTTWHNLLALATPKRSKSHMQMGSSLPKQKTTLCYMYSNDRNSVFCKHQQCRTLAMPKAETRPKLNQPPSQTVTRLQTQVSWWSMRTQACTYTHTRAIKKRSKEICNRNVERRDICNVNLWLHVHVPRTRLPKLQLMDNNEKEGNGHQAHKYAHNCWTQQLFP